MNQVCVAGHKAQFESEFDQRRFDRFNDRVAELGGDVRVSPDIWHMKVPNWDYVSSSLGYRTVCDGSLPPNSIVADAPGAEA